VNLNGFDGSLLLRLLSKLHHYGIMIEGLEGGGREEGGERFNQSEGSSPREV
jgi:hypothetical protein